MYLPIFSTAFLEYNDYNIFTVDWSELAAVPWYNTAAKNTKHVSKHLARFIDHLTTSTDARTEDFHLIGFSLGAHVVGLTNNELKYGKVKHITGKRQRIRVAHRNGTGTTRVYESWNVKFSNFLKKCPSIKKKKKCLFQGLDPAEVLFSSSGPDERLDHSQAKLVDVVHTSGGFLGFKERIGHRDFYPNGGAWPQPGCKIDYAGR